MDPNNVHIHEALCELERFNIIIGIEFKNNTTKCVQQQQQQTPLSTFETSKTLDEAILRIEHLINMENEYNRQLAETMVNFDTKRLFKLGYRLILDRDLQPSIIHAKHLMYQHDVIPYDGNIFPASVLQKYIFLKFKDEPCSL